MATFQASLKTLSAIPCSLAELVTGMNRYACTNSQGGLRFTTAFLAEYDPASRTLTYINAGHNTPILRRSAGAVERLTVGGLPLGIQAEAGYESGSLVLQEGDWLVIFTDGLVGSPESARRGVWRTAPAGGAERRRSQHSGRNAASHDERRGWFRGRDPATR